MKLSKLMRFVYDNEDKLETDLGKVYNIALEYDLNERNLEDPKKLI